MSFFEGVCIQTILSRIQRVSNEVEYGHFAFGGGRSEIG